MTLALPIFALGCFANTLNEDRCLPFFGLHFNLTQGHMVMWGVSALFMSILAFKRYQRFSEYRVKGALYALITKRGYSKGGKND
jgi:hypothetical protein